MRFFRICSRLTQLGEGVITQYPADPVTDFSPHRLTAPKAPSFLPEEAASYYRASRAKAFGKPLTELCSTPEEREAALVGAEKAVAVWSAMLGASAEGPFLEGKTVSYGGT